ncbi:hypothetical protein [Dyadobacter sp. NIV53]|nr:hypothetical protein [Dyadobacter sp. NIV53]
MNRNIGMGILQKRQNEYRSHNSIRIGKHHCLAFDHCHFHEEGI